MSESLITFIGIYFLTYFKFIAGPVLGHAAGYTVIETILVTITGMMSSVIFFTLIGTKFRKILALRFTRKKTVFTKKNRTIVHLWGKYGEIGIAFITPLLLTPIGGTLILVSFGTKKRKIYSHMLWSATFWAIFFSLTIDQLLKFSFLKSLLE